VNGGNARFGLEGLVNLGDLGRVVQTEFFLEEFALEVGVKKVRIAVFDRVVVSVEAVREESTGKQKVKMMLVEPKIE
jgi:S1 domain